MTQEKIGISGANGFIGNKLSSRLEQWEPLSRYGNTKGKDLVYDLASHGNLSHQKDVRETYKANFFRVIESLENFKGKFIFVSTSSVTLPVQTHYSASKKSAEEYIKVKAQEGTSACIVRPYSITGVGEQPEHLIPKLIDSCLNGTRMPFVREPVHDFLDVDDFVDGLLTIAEKAPMNGEIYNLGSGVQYTNQEVLDIVEDVTGKKASTYSIGTMRNYDTKEWRSDNTRAYSLGWEPKKTLTESISQMVYARKNT